MTHPPITCGTCRFFRDGLSMLSSVRYRDGIGECRRHAPRGPLVLAWQHADDSSTRHMPIITPFPVVPADDWCGEHAPWPDAEPAQRQTETA